jgi:UDP:flavonoid glycosyltransferase YjiC (YdhE family)
MFPGAVPVSRRNASEQLDLPLDDESARARFDASWLSIAQRWGVEFATLGSVVHTASAAGETTLLFTTEDVAGPAGIPSGWECIGPLIEPIPRAAVRPERPLVYVCFGTSFNRRTYLFNTVIAALADEPLDVIVSTGRGPVSAAELGDLPENVVVHEFVATREVLATASVHVSHCGCNSVHESLLAGVPLVCMPQAYDQFPLAGRVHELGAGYVAEETVASVRAAVRRLIDDPGPTARANELAEHLNGYDSPARVAAIVSRVLAAHSLTNA